jgi:rod shape-determining protein MreD
VKQASRHCNWIIAVTLAGALILNAVPLPETAAYYRPDWLALVLIYWCMALPGRVGVGVGWLNGLLLDVMNATLLGQHALAMTIIAFLALKLHQRIRVFPLWQQSFFILLLVGLHLWINLWIKGITGYPPQPWTYWMPAVTSMLLWPWMFVLLRGLRRQFRVT